MVLVEEMGDERHPLSRAYPVPMHDASAEKMSQGWVASCRNCGWLGADYQSSGPAAEEARQHRHQQRQPWSLETVEPWDPGRHPFDPA
jgi:hypothetical protein